METYKKIGKTELKDRNSYKITAGLVLILLFTGFSLAGEGATWQSPSDQNFRNSTVFSMTADWQNQALDVNSAEFVLNPENGVRFSINGVKKNPDCESECVYAANFELDERPIGEYSVYGETMYETDTTGVTKEKQLLFDNQPPKIDEKFPKNGFIPDSETFSVYYLASDKHSQVVESFIALRSESDDLNLNSTISSLENISSSTLEPNTKYTVFYQVQDLLGNTETGKWNFYTDKKYEADEKPKINPESPVKWPENGKMNITAFFSEGEKFDLTLNCYDDEGRFDSEAESRNDRKTDGIKLSCQAPLRFLNEKKNLTFEYCDEAENCINESKTYQFDGDKPTIQTVNLPSKNIKGDFKLPIEANDATTSVNKAYYKIGDQEIREANLENETILVRTNNLRRGSKTLGIVVEDSVGHRSSSKEVNFNYNPSGPTEINLDVQHSSTISGENTDIKVDIKNTGDYYISEETLNVKSRLGDTSIKIKHLEPGETANKRVMLNTSEKYGTFDIEIGSESINYIVKPTSRQTEKIVKVYNDKENKLSEWKSKISDLNDKNVQTENLTNYLDEYESSINSIGNNIDNTTFYLTPEDITEAEKVQENMEKEYQNKLNDYRQRRAKNIILTVIISTSSILLILRSFFWYSDDYNLEDGKMTAEIKNIIAKCSQSNAMNKVRRLLDQIISQMRQSELLEKIKSNIPIITQFIPEEKISKFHRKISEDVDKSIKKVSDPKFEEYDYNDN
jgi:hypothetical protein